MTYPKVPAVFFVISQVAIPEPCQLSEPIGNIFGMDVSYHEILNVPPAPVTSLTHRAVMVFPLQVSQDRQSCYAATDFLLTHPLYQIPFGRSDKDARLLFCKISVKG